MQKSIKTNENRRKFNDFLVRSNFDFVFRFFDHSLLFTAKNISFSNLVAWLVLKKRKNKEKKINLDYFSVGIYV